MLCHVPSPSISLSVSALWSSVVIMTRLQLASVVLIAGLLTLLPVSLAGIVLSELIFSTCPGKSNLPVAHVKATSVW